MNIQTERIENHKARFTVEVDNSKLEEAKKRSAREISKRYNIPGFRRGKAPYRILVNYIGEAPIIEDAVDRLGNDVYRDALESSEISPYGPGELEDFKLDPQPTFIFTVPMEPEVTLSEYRAVRMDYEAPEVGDEEVEQSIKALLDEHATVEASEEPAADGNRVTVDVHSEFVDGDERAEDNEDNPEDETIYKGDPFLHRHDMQLKIGSENDPVLPGFSAALVGANVGDTVEFELTVPDENPYEEIKGRQVQFHVDIKTVETVTLPELDDAFAEMVSDEVNMVNDDENPASVDKLREHLRDELQKQANARAKAEYVDKMIGEIVSQAEVGYPEMMIEERLDEMLEEREQYLRNQGLSLETYMAVTSTTKESIREEMREDAAGSVVRTLVLRQLLVDEKVEVPAARIDEQIDSLVSQFGEQADAFRAYFDNQETRQNIAGNLLYEALMDRLFKIGRGEPVDEPEASEDEAEATDAPASDESNESEQ